MTGVVQHLPMMVFVLFQDCLGVYFFQLLEVFCVFLNNKVNFLPSKTENTWNTQKTENTKDTQNNILKMSKFDPDCAQKARETPEPTALKIILSWQKKRRYTRISENRICQNIFRSPQLEFKFRPAP